jgi:hypothetical protein
MQVRYIVPMSTYRLTNRPAGTAFVAYDCRRCEATELKRPVFVTDGTQTIAAGTRCAAILLGLVNETATTSEADRAIRSMRAEESQKNAADEDARWNAFLAETGMVPGLAAMKAYSERNAA